MSIEQLGVSECAVIFNKLGFVFREQPVEDYGIDAHIETKENDYPSGKLIAVQIKSGLSFFKNSTNESYIFRGEMKHYKYWLNHSLPVIIVLYNPENETCYWQSVTRETATITGKGWKIEIPKDNILSEANEALISLANSKSKFQHRYNTLLFAKPWIEDIKAGKKYVLNVEEWINKSSGRGKFMVNIVDDYGNNELILNQEFIGFGTRPYHEVFEKMFPWAKILIDEEFYEGYELEHDEDDYLSLTERCYLESVQGTFKKEKWQFETSPESPTFEEWKNNLTNLRPYRIGAGEVAFYQLVLEINEVGDAFYTFDNFITRTEMYDNLLK